LCQGDAPYWYNERANISILAAAAWRNGWVALEEFQSGKQVTNQSDDGSEPEEAELPHEWLGRCDLYLASDSKHELVEAKFNWLSMKSPQPQKRAEDILDRAVADAKATSVANDDYDAVGVAFVPVYARFPVDLSTAATLAAIEDDIQATISQLSAVGADAVAWCFPKELRLFKSTKTHNAVPGIVMLARKIPKP